MGEFHGLLMICYWLDKASLASWGGATPTRKNRKKELFLEALKVFLTL
jgi:hypothetical protein